MNTGNLGVTGETSEEYHSKDAVSASRLRVFKRKPGGPQLYHQTYVAKTLEREETDAMKFGSALHMATLEPDKFAGEYVTVPEDAPARPTDKMRTAKNPNASSIQRVAWWTAFEAETAGKTIIDAKDFKVLASMGAAIRSHPAASMLLAAGVAEQTFRIKAPGLPNLPPLQCRPDWYRQQGCELSEGRPYVLDIKSTTTLDTDAFGTFLRQVEDHVYHQQAALYMAILTECGFPVRDFFFVAAEKCAPFGVEVYRLEDRPLERGQEEVSRLLIRLDECYKRNEWPNTKLGVLPLNLSPRYWARDIEAAA